MERMRRLRFMALRSAVTGPRTAVSVSWSDSSTNIRHRGLQDNSELGFGSWKMVTSSPPGPSSSPSSAERRKETDMTVKEKRTAFSGTAGPPPCFSLTSPMPSQDSLIMTEKPPVQALSSSPCRLSPSTMSSSRSFSADASATS